MNTKKFIMLGLDSAITETRNFPVFMVPDEEYPNATIIDFPILFKELNSKLGSVKRVGLVGNGRMPADCYKQIALKELDKLIKSLISMKVTILSMAEFQKIWGKYERLA